VSSPSNGPASSLRAHPDAIQYEIGQGDGGSSPLRAP